MEYLPQIVEIVIPALTALCGLAVGRINRLKKRDAEKDTAHEAEMKAIKDGVKSLLRGQIIDLGLHYIKEGDIPPYGLDNLENYYTAYVDLGDGDRSTHDIMQTCRRLPIRSGGE